MLVHPKVRLYSVVLVSLRCFKDSHEFADAFSRLGDALLDRYDPLYSKWQ